MESDPSPTLFPGGHHSTGFVAGSRGGRGLHALSEAGIRISLGIVIVLLLVFTVTVQKTARSITRENALLIEQLKTVEADRIRLKSELERIVSERGKSR